MIVCFENEFSACVNTRSCCSEGTAILSTSLQCPSVLQNRGPKWKKPMRPYKSRLFTGNRPKSLENTGFWGSVLISWKAVNSAVYGVSFKTQNLVVATPCGLDPRFRHQKEKPHLLSPDKDVFYVGYGVTSWGAAPFSLFTPQIWSPAGYSVFLPLWQGFLSQWEYQSSPPL